MVKKKYSINKIFKNTKKYIIQKPKVPDILSELRGLKHLLKGRRKSNRRKRVKSKRKRKSKRRLKTKRRRRRR